MLVQLSIRNLILVEHLELRFGSGLTVLTGETGAGKSILIQALSLLLGGKASPDLIREGADEGEVEALFEVNSTSSFAARLSNLEIKASDGQVVIRRVLRRKGRGRVLINGQAATVGMLAELLGGWMDLTSQHEHVALLDPSQHLTLLDEYAGLAEPKERVKTAYENVEVVRRRLNKLQSDDAEIERRKDYLRFALEEISSADPDPNELETLHAERKRLRGMTSLVEGLQTIESVLYSQPGAVVEQMGATSQRLRDLAQIDSQLGAWSERAGGLWAEVEELSRELSRHLRHLEMDPERLLEVEDRIHLLERLVRKYGGRLDLVLDTQQEMAQELSELENLASRRAEVQQALAAREEELAEVASELSKLRAVATSAFEAAVGDALALLAMRDTRVVVQLAPLATISSYGAETAEILFAPNKGESLSPLRRTASGGELSRVLLAIKQVLSDRHPVGLHVFDEVDTGIGGAVAEAVGSQLARVAARSQVVVVTHLPQVAAFAERHVRVFKQTEKNRTMTQIEELKAQGSVKELARMLGGAKVTARTRALAEELRERAREQIDQKLPNRRSRQVQSRCPTGLNSNFCTSKRPRVDKAPRVCLVERRVTG